jgi:outer membrane biosynthesis protein TonB
MDRVFYYDSYKIESSNKRTGFLISAILHSLLLLIILWRFLEIPIIEEHTIDLELMMTPKETDPPQEDIVKGGGSSAGPESEEPKEGGSEGSEAKPSLDEMEKEPTKIEVIKPVEIPPTATSNPKPILTAPETQVVKIDPPKVETRPAPSKPAPVNEPAPNKPSTPVVTSPSPPVVSNPKPSTNSGGGSSGRATTGDDDHAGSGGSGTGSGTGGTGSGGATSGSGTGGGGNQGNGTGTGSGDGVGVNFDETGPLTRKIKDRARVTDLAGDNIQTLVFDMCINQAGAVTYIRFNTKMSKTRDKSFIIEATRRVKQMTFYQNFSAPRKECGTYTLKILPTTYELVPK